MPIKLHTATDNKTVRFREVHEPDGAPLEHRRLDPESGEVVPYDDIVKGFEIGEDEYVVLTKEEVKAAAGERTKTIPIEEFVPANDIDPVYFAKTYYVGPREGGEEAYKALQTALEETGRAGIGRMTFHDREYLVAVRALENVLALHQLRFADEVAGKEDLEFTEPGRGPSEREIKMAGSLVESLAADFTPEDYDDTYRERVVSMIEAKAKGKQVIQPEPDEPAEESDLFAALEASVKGMKK
ncbi:MAG: end-binding protein Ku [Solirubrobacteraceae bacterium]|nr:end-binding protein Ku [Solirubrobacteraceae bacterium]